MALDFPSSPTVGQSITIGDKTWTYNGKGWKLIPIQALQGLQGAQGIIGLQGTQGLQGNLGNFQGTQGLQGVQGRQGVQGLSGTSQGTQGTFGPATIPVSTDTLGSGDTIVANDNGKTAVITGDLIIANVFNPGENVVIYNDSAAQVAITTSTGVLLRLAGTSQTGTRYMQQRGIATVLCVKTGEYAISGAGVT